MLVKQHAVRDGQAASVQEGANHAQSLGRLLCYLADMYQPGPHRRTVLILPTVLAEKLDWSGPSDAFRSLNKEYGGALLVADGNTPTSQPMLKVYRDGPPDKR